MCDWFDIIACLTNTNICIDILFYKYLRDSKNAAPLIYLLYAVLHRLPKVTKDENERIILLNIKLKTPS